jgi:hypothetical protein
MAVDTWFVRLGVLYALVGMVLGIVMGIGEDFAYKSVHAHINLAGWASMAIFGLVYRGWPELKSAALAKWHFWVMNVGVLLLVIGIALQVATAGHMPVVVIVGSLITLLGMLLFAGLVWTRLGR